jgi:hypothetical protein
MAEILGIVASTVAVVETALNIVRALREYSSAVVSAGTRRRIVNTYGRFASTVLYVVLNPAYEQIERMERYIVTRQDQDIEKFRDRYISECNMAAVAVSPSG